MDEIDIEIGYQDVTVEELLEANFEYGLQYMRGVRLPYHNIDHVNHMLAQFEGYAGCNSRFRRVFEDPQQNLIVRLAIAWHDAVYEVGAPAGENERLSAELFEDSFTILDHEYFPMLVVYVDKVKNLIMATSKHFTGYQPRDEAEAVIMDLDLLTFSWDYDDFVRVNDKLNEEARAMFAPDVAAAGRLRFFESLDGNFQYHILRGIEEERAIKNIKRYTKRIRGGI